MASPIDSVVQQYLGLVGSIGRAAISSQYPDDIEYYMLALELTDFMDNTIDYFSWPIMPKSFTKSENNRINIKKSYASVNVINSKSFTPHDIVIKGNFGRTFQLLLSVNKPVNFKAFSYSIDAGVKTIKDLDPTLTKTEIATFNPIVKTGYGCTKILQFMINKASGSDKQGRPFKLYLYNPMLGESYLVVPNPNSMTLMQNEGANNMIWEYTLNLTAIAPLLNNTNKLRNSTANILAADNIRKGLGVFVSSVRKFVAVSTGNSSSLSQAVNVRL